MKLCKDCRHAEKTEHEWMCRHPIAGNHRYTDMVTGEDRVLETPCQTARNLGECGREAKFWKPADCGLPARMTQG